MIIYSIFLYIAINDYKTKEIQNIPLIIMFIIEILNKYKDYKNIQQIAIEILLSVFIYIFMIIITVIIENKHKNLVMGGGDIKLLAVMYFIIGEDIAIMLAVGAFLLFSESFVRKIINKYKEKETALAPYLFLGYNAVLILRNIM